MPEFRSLLDGYTRFKAGPWAEQRRRYEALAERGQHVPRLSPLVTDDEAHRFGEQPVAGEDRDVLAVPHVQRRLAAAQVVVVHRR